MKKSAFYVSIGTALAGFALLVCAPAEAAAGARRGLSVCAGVIIPSLFPFLILSALLTALGFPYLLAKTAGGLTAKLFGVSGAAAAPLLLGLTGGYPVGAAATAEVVRRGELVRRRASAFCPSATTPARPSSSARRAAAFSAQQSSDCCCTYATSSPPSPWACCFPSASRGGGRNSQS